MDARDTTAVATLRLPAETTIYAAAALKEALLESLARTESLELDLSGVEEFDSAGLQLLLLTRREAAAAGKRLRLIEPSAPVRGVLTLLGLDEALSAPGLLAESAGGAA